MRLNLLFTIVFLSFSIVSFANDTKSTTPPDTTSKLVDRAAAMLLIDEGRVLFDEGRVKDALNLFREAAAKDPYGWKAPYWISTCHLHMANYGLALKYAKEAIRNNAAEVDKDIYEIIASCFHQMGQLDSAITNYNTAIKYISSSRAKDLKINEKIDQCNRTKEWMTNGQKSMRTRISGEINTGYNEYAPIVTSNGKVMYFASRRSNTKGGQVNPEDQEFFEDVYRTEWLESEQKWDSITNELDRLNSVGFDAISYISPDGMYGLMTLNTSMSDLKNKTSSGEICEIEFTDKGKWSTPKIIKNKSINTKFGESCATLTADGNTMYFMSDRNHDKKMREIYVVHRDGKKWGTAVALSDSINTPGNETTPYITPDGRYLFFSSDGHQGMGGLDVFVSENLGDNKWTKPVNLGIIVNSVNDDTHFVYYPDLKKAFMSSIEIIGNKSSRDLYEVDMSNFTFPKFY